MKSKLSETPQYLCSLPSDQAVHDEIDIESILSREAVISQQDSICGKIGTPTTIIQFRLDENNDWDRLDSQVSAITLRTSCDLLRRCVNNEGKFCRDCDVQHAELFYEMTFDKIRAGELESRIGGKQKEWDEMYHNPPEYHELRVEKCDKRIFLSYNCPMFGYRELIFPIFFEGRVVAVFFVGQIKLEGQEGVIKSSKENFFSHEENKNIFDIYLKECDARGYNKKNPEKYTSDKIIECIIDGSKHEIIPRYEEIYKLKQGLQIPVVEDQLSQEQYNEMLKIVCEWLDKLDKILIEEMRRKREKYTSYVLAKALFDFRTDSVTGDIDNLFSIHKMLWTPVQAFIERVSEQCSLEYMVVYGVSSIGKKAVSKFVRVAISNPDFSSVVPESFSFEDSPINFIMNEPSDSKMSPILFNALSPIPSDAEQVQMGIVFYPMKEISAAPIIILVKYPDGMLKESIEDALISGLQNLAMLISLRLAVQFENAAQKSLETTLRLYKHEMVNLTSDISRAIHEYLGNPQLVKIDPKKIKDVYRDAASTLSMFEFLSKNIGLLLDDEPIFPEKKNVPIYQELLYKWENNKRMDALDKGCDFEFHKSHINIYTDPRYAEIVVYNLLTNAVKYAYDNTMIYMHCTRSRPQNIYTNNCVLSVTNFTFTIEGAARTRIFEMGFRTSKAREYYPEGNGFGLNLARKAMNILGGTVKLCEPELISNYNIPLLHAYVKNHRWYADFGTANDFEEAKKEYNRLANEYIINDLGVFQDKISWVISKRKGAVPTRSLVQAELHNATYMIRFEVVFYE